MINLCRGLWATLFLSLVLLSFQISAEVVDVEKKQAKQLLMVGPPQLSSGSNVLASQIHKIILEVAMQVNDYQMIISNPVQSKDAKSAIYRLVVNIKDQEKEIFKVNVKIEHVRSGGTIKEIIKDQIQLRRLLITVRQSLLELFFGGPKSKADAAAIEEQHRIFLEKSLAEKIEQKVKEILRASLELSKQLADPDPKDDDGEASYAEALRGVKSDQEKELEKKKS